MISISENFIDYSVIERKIFYELFSSREVRQYDSPYEMEFEVWLRAAIVNAAIQLNRSGFQFAVWEESFCNPAYWVRYNKYPFKGGFILRTDVKPSDAIKDIYINGSKYGTECSTAMAIVYYKALVDIFPEKLFNALFHYIFLWDWEKTVWDHLGLTDIYAPARFVPGDCIYFSNPDFDKVNHPAWPGENTIYLGDGYYYGHGIGITTANEIIKILNTKRKSGATKSAYILNQARRPNFKGLAYTLYNYIARRNSETIAYPCIWW